MSISLKSGRFLGQYQVGLAFICRFQEHQRLRSLTRVLLDSRHSELLRCALSGVGHRFVFHISGVGYLRLREGDVGGRCHTLHPGGCPHVVQEAFHAGPWVSTFDGVYPTGWLSGIVNR